MDDATLIALKESIEKWGRRAAGNHSEPLGIDSCPLCRLFHANNRVDAHRGCQGCPVFEKTQQTLCEGTPYLDYVDASGIANANANAQKELEFLRSLLPAEEEKKSSFTWVDLDYL